MYTCTPTLKSKQYNEMLNILSTSRDSKLLKTQLKLKLNKKIAFNNYNEINYNVKNINDFVFISTCEKLLFVVG